MVQMTGEEAGRLTADDLRLRLGPTPASGVGEWLYLGLRTAVTAGDLGSGTTLPSSRRIASELGLARGTVTGALDRLLAEGLLRSAPRSGIVVTPPAHADPAPRVPTSRQAPISPGTPDPALFPRTAWSRSFREGLAGLSSAELGYPDVQGLPWLRSELAAHLHRSRGAVVEPDSIVVVAGVAQGYALMARALGVGAVLAVEDPGSPGSSDVFAQLGMTLAPASVDVEGLQVDALRDGAAAVVVTPAHQYPTGVPLAPERRRALAAWARDGRRWIIEDDYDAELRYDRAPVPVVQSLAPDRTVLAGSISKTLSPALRLGWLVAPPELVGVLVDGKRSSDLGCSVPEQAALAGFLRSGAYGRHTRRVRSTYRRRRALLVDAVARVATPSAQPTVLGVPAGLHVAVELASAECEQAALTEIRAAARANPVVSSGLAVESLSAGSRSGDRFGLVIGTARMNETAATTVAQAIGGALTS